MKYLRFTSGLLFLFPAVVVAIPTTRPSELTIVFSRQPTTRPALRRHLLPTLGERTAGNSVPAYLTAVQMATQVSGSDLAMTREQAAEWRTPLPAVGEDLLSYFVRNDVPLAVPTRDAAKNLIGRFEHALRYADLAARRRSTEWDSPFPEFGLETLLPHVSGMSQIAKANCVRIRLQITARDYDAAIRSIQTNLELSRALADEKVLVSNLAGVAFASMTLDQIVLLISQPDAPNLYWPLADLPKPFFDLRTVMQAEKEGLLASIPELRRVKTGDFSSEDWRRMSNRLARLTDGARPPTGEALVPAFAGVMLFASARDHLIVGGLTPKQVDEMPQSMVLGRYLLDTYETWNDEACKWSGVPYWQAAEGLWKTEQALDKAKQKDPLNPMYAIFPAVGRVYWTTAKLERQIALLQTVEALRDHASAHAGKLPDRLEDLTDAPAPIDPTTGKPFLYHSTMGGATLDSPTPPHGRPQDGLHLTITLRR